jgi:hypothetical protein
MGIVSSSLHINHLLRIIGMLPLISGMEMLGAITAGLSFSVSVRDMPNTILIGSLRKPHGHPTLSGTTVPAQCEQWRVCLSTMKIPREKQLHGGQLPTSPVGSNRFTLLSSAIFRCFYHPS